MICGGLLFEPPRSLFYYLLVLTSESQPDNKNYCVNSSSHSVNGDIAQLDKSTRQTRNPKFVPIGRKKALFSNFYFCCFRCAVCRR